MNLLGISLPNSGKSLVPKATRGVPLDAPKRPGEWKCLSLFYFSAGLTFVSLALGWPYLLAALGITGIVGGLILKPLQRRHYDRIGWYQKHEVKIPERLAVAKTLAFGEEEVEFFRYKSFSLGVVPSFTIPYSQIREVHTDCQGICLEGIIICFSDGKGPAAKIETQRVFDYGNGELTRTVLAVLRLKAPHATFSGPQWIEEGWAPRTGFNHPDRSGSGGEP